MQIDFFFWCLQLKLSFDNWCNIFGKKCLDLITIWVIFMFWPLPIMLNNQDEGLRGD
jgi:hypothetical protein